MSTKETSNPTLTFKGTSGFEGQQVLEGQQCRHLPFNFGTYSRPGNDPMKNRIENQDCFVVEDKWGGHRNQFLACVFDGHGPNGQLVSTFCRDVWPTIALTEMTQQQGKLSEVAKVNQDEKYLKNVFKLACAKTSASLGNSPIDTYVSGTTFTGFVCTERKCWTINVGDSRVVACTKNGAVYKAVDQTVDQNPNRPDEQARIIATGGRVFDWGVPRVWLAKVDMPGLAMSRSFGDEAAESVGVFSEPEIRSFEMDSNTAFVIVATDGVWEFISSQEAVDLVASFHANGQSPQEACTALVNESLKLWNEEEDVVDSITAIVVFNMNFGNELSLGINISKVEVGEKVVVENGDVGVDKMVSGEDPSVAGKAMQEEVNESGVVGDT